MSFYTGDIMDDTKLTTCDICGVEFVGTWDLRRDEDWVDMCWDCFEKKKGGKSE